MDKNVVKTWGGEQGQAIGGQWGERETHGILSPEKV